LEKAMSRSSHTRVGAVIVLVGLLPCAAVAHHSRAAFDTAVEVLLEGTVADVTWANPHTYFRLETRDSEGKSVLQEVEVGPLSTLQPLGLTRAAITPGDRVTVRVNPNRRGPGHLVVGLELTKSDGNVYPLHVVRPGRPAPAALPATSLAGRWVPANDGFMGIVQGSRNWPLTDAGRAGVADGAGDSQGRCTAWPAPLLMGLPMLRTIEVGADRVSFTFDWMGASRIVLLGAEHPRDLQPTLQGHSIGRWDGDTLVIDSIGFTPHEEGAGFGVPSGEGKHLVERLTLLPDRSRLVYEFTVEDSLSLKEPVTYSMQWVHRPDLQPTGQECDRELATRFLRE
jgi:hypothetical protein